MWFYVFIWMAWVSWGVLPLGHVAYAYLWYVVVAVVLRRPVPARLALVPLVVGSQFPDLVDKPLAYYEVVTYGRAIGHSVFTFVVVSVVVWWVGQRYTEYWTSGSWQATLWWRTPLAFSVGVLSHLIGDAWPAIAQGTFTEARWLLWPLFRMPPVPADDIPPLTRLLQAWRAMEQHPQLEILLLAAVVFVGVRVLTLLRGRPLLHGPPAPGQIRD